MTLGNMRELGVQRLLPVVPRLSDVNVNSGQLNATTLSLSELT
jgi:hypothetical protein